MNTDNDYIENGKAFAIQVLVANELGLTNRCVDYAKLYMNGKLFPMQYSQLQNAAIEAVQKIQDAKLESKAQELAIKYLN